jgi:GNAT superfamily N-acetyltransferase
MTFTITTQESSRLPEEQVFPMVALLNSIWPNPEKSVAEHVAAFLARYREHREGAAGLSRTSIRHLAWQAGQLAGHTHTFERRVMTEAGDIPVMALSGVCVAEPFRGMGIGAALVRSAFERVEQGEFGVSLFQTTVPGFYRKLGAVAVDNVFRNSRNEADPEASPWGDEEIMIYPSGFDWPKGVIDLNGPGY